MHDASRSPDPGLNGRHQEERFEVTRFGCTSTLTAGGIGAIPATPNGDPLAVWRPMQVLYRQAIRRSARWSCSAGEVQSRLESRLPA